MSLFEGSITNVEGLSVGQVENNIAKTGVTVVLCDENGATVAVDVRGAAPGTRETDLCKPENTVEYANGVLLSGGSAFGLAAATGVMRFLEENQVGVDMGCCRVPIVPAAVIFDLFCGDWKVRPDDEMGYQACTLANSTVKQGCYGAGSGATVGKIIPSTTPAKGGVGTASITLSNGVTVGAIVVVNACGDIYHPHSGECIACASAPNGELVECEQFLLENLNFDISKIDLKSGSNTTIGVIATDAKLTKAESKRMATSAHDGLARTIRPVHTQMDGDTIFAMATGRKESKVNPIQLGTVASEVMARAIANAITAVKAQ